ncbi:hypothetical protein GX50_03393 [[Emmonsia] crescens]|uniref:Uncharacterized protein n=1 Tax=[Emmonsia] crescens TaxID=73230 RepID=A0A2B7ZBJ2_9EURO|nr:hypothetical protein GX50_03393 [Emmonsia crescens]
MPVKWTPEMDQQLLLKILETHELSVDTKKVSQAWPGDDPNAKPTPRAITERLAKIKAQIKNGNGPTPTSTPKKLATPTSRKRTSAKRKHGDVINASAGTENIKTEAFISPTSNVNNIKHEYTDFSDSSIDGMAVSMTMRTPSKRARVAPPLPAGMITYNEDTDDDVQYESSASDFIHPAKIEVDNGYGNVHVHDDEAVGAADYA